MRREASVPRPDWQAKCEAVGFGFHSADGGYWDESVCYVFDAGQIDRLEAVTEELHQCCLQAVDAVVQRQAFERFRMPRLAQRLVTQSWQRREPSLYGRFDFSWDGRGEPRLLEYNADTPTSLLEAAVVQWYWLQDVRAHSDQFNSLHEKLVERWRALALPGEVVLAAMWDNREDRDTLCYLLDTALQAGLRAQVCDMEEIGWGRANGRFVDMNERPIDALFKLYPWEWMMREAFGEHVAAGRTRFIEPPWKMLLSNKAILTLLWEMFPDHPNLLPATCEPGQWAASHVKKPLYSREGANVSIRSQAGNFDEGGAYGAEGYIWQAYCPLPCFDGRYPVIGSWIVGDRAAGIGIREDDSPITRNSSRFVPHCFD